MTSTDKQSDKETDREADTARSGYAKTVLKQQREKSTSLGDYNRDRAAGTQGLVRA